MIKIDSIELYGSKKILTIELAAKLIDELKKQGKTIGLCHGGFDLMHPGHIKHFESAKKLCDVLFVSITSDEFVTSRKGDGRPVYPDKLRAYTISSIEFVDYVIITNYKSGIDVIKLLSPSFYIKGPDFINKTTPGITAERQAIKDIGGEIKYTNEPPLSTTGIINYIKKEIKDNNLLLLIDRDGTLIKNDDFFGKENDCINKIYYNDAVIDFIQYLQTKFQTTKFVITNQAGVARKLFTTKTVEDINNLVNNELEKIGIKIDSWQYCPDVDLSYANSHPEIDFDYNFVKEKTKRKPGFEMVNDALSTIKKSLTDFDKIIVIGNGIDDEALAKNLNSYFINVTDKDYEELITIFKELKI